MRTNEGNCRFLLLFGIQVTEADGRTTWCWYQVGFWNVLDADADAVLMLMPISAWLFNQIQKSLRNDLLRWKEWWQNRCQCRRNSWQVLTKSPREKNRQKLNLLWIEKNCEDNKIFCRRRKSHTGCTKLETWNPQFTRCSHHKKSLRTQDAWGCGDIWGWGRFGQRPDFPQFLAPFP